MHKITFSSKHTPPYLPEAPLLVTGTESHPGCQFETGSWLIRWLVLICVKQHDKQYTEMCWCCSRRTSLVLVLRVIGSAGRAQYMGDKNSVSSTLFGQVGKTCIKIRSPNWLRTWYPLHHTFLPCGYCNRLPN